MSPAHTDWLYHHLSVSGPAETLTAFQAAAAGAGVIPWMLDLDRAEEDVFLRLVSARDRTISFAGARLLAGELRDAVGRNHARAVGRVGRSFSCPFDLQALLPAPSEVLLLGPDHPDALAWLWANWGTTQVLRHVGVLAGRATDAFRVTFWSADWTPWRAVQSVRSAWPALRFEIRPVYDLT